VLIESGRQLAEQFRPGSGRVHHGLSPKPDNSGVICFFPQNLPGLLQRFSKTSQINRFFDQALTFSDESLVQPASALTNPTA
jgi:hypothetical protein